MILVQFSEREVDITNLEKEIKEKIKEAKVKQKDERNMYIVRIKKFVPDSADITDKQKYQCVKAYYFSEKNVKAKSGK